ncbi:YhdH/YhfP family quinone oxidoreductase [Latilactobacillus sakei]|uniref:YhdH/YhfP family quinone oxidoreductase n=1 Tax=Latilactobacillus sakei TaxID=1599 RepID=UPI003A855289
MVAYQALVLTHDNETVTAQYATKLTPDLPKEGVLIKVAYSDINYKDRLTMNAKSGVLKNYPATPGVDFVGTVVTSDNPFFEAGECVLCTGYGTGISIDGGYAQYVKVPSEWLLKCPIELTPQETMQLGTAGFTAAIALTKILRQPFTRNHDTPLLITGATGGVGSYALTMLAQLGFTNITATTRDLSQTDYLTKLGAKQVIATDDLLTAPLKPLAHQSYTGVIDTLGGDVLAHILSYMAQDGLVAACGNAAGFKLATTVFPFILRGVTLVGIDSVNYPRKDRKEIWQLLATNFKPQTWPLIRNIAFSELATELSMPTKQAGRVVVTIDTEH